MSLVINIRGSNGSGKSTLVRRVLEAHQAKPVMQPGRARPIAYVCEAHDPRLAFIGSYENPTGGADTITGGIERIFSLVQTYADAGVNVLFEGIVAQHSATRLLAVREKHDVEVVVLTTSLDDCVASVRERRAARGATTDEFDPKNVVKEYKSVLSSTRRLRGDGVKIHEMDRDEALRYVAGRLACCGVCFDQFQPTRGCVCESEQPEPLDDEGAAFAPIK